MPVGAGRTLGFRVSFANPSEKKLHLQSLQLEKLAGLGFAVLHTAVLCNFFATRA